MPGQHLAGISNFDLPLARSKPEAPGPIQGSSAGSMEPRQPGQVTSSTVVSSPKPLAATPTPNRRRRLPTRLRRNALPPPGLGVVRAAWIEERPGRYFRQGIRTRGLDIGINEISRQWRELADQIELLERLAGPVTAIGNAPMTNDPIVHVIDDDDAARDALRFLLHAANFSVRTYESAKIFLDAIPATEAG